MMRRLTRGRGRSSCTRGSSSILNWSKRSASRTSKTLGCFKSNDRIARRTDMTPRLVLAFALWPALPVYAHHSGAAFDRSKTVEVHGAVEKLEWTSPHARLYVAAKDDKGAAVTWDFELPSPVTLMRRGW